MQSVLHSVIGPAGPQHADLSGKVAVVTGGALGIGYEIARAFALENCRVIMVNRKEDQGDEAIAKIQADYASQPALPEGTEPSGNKELGAGLRKMEKADVEWVGCDLGDLKMVKEVFEGIAEREKRLDLLILSAGINTNQYGVDADGIDRHFGVNALGHFYAVNLLYPLIRKTSQLPECKDVPPRIVFESSEMHRMAPANVHFGSLDEINNDKLGPTELYGRTKLALILYAKYGLVEKVIKPNGDNVYAFAVHPGAVNTDMQDQWETAYPGLFGKLVKNVTLMMGRDPEQGSYSALYAATSPEPLEKGWNGYYFSDPAQPGKETSLASDPYLGTALWELSTRLVQEKVGKDALKPWDK